MLLDTGTTLAIVPDVVYNALIAAVSASSIPFCTLLACSFSCPSVEWPMRA